MSLPRNRKAAGLALAGTVVIHVSAFFGAVGLLVVAAVNAIDSPEPDEGAYTVVLSPDLFVAEEEPPQVEERRALQYVDTDSSTEVAPEEVPESSFISDRDTTASSEIAPAEGGDLDTPALEGADDRHVELATTHFRDGEDAPPPPTELTPPAEDRPEVQPVPEIAAAPAPPLSAETRDHLEEAASDLHMPLPELVTEEPDEVADDPQDPVEEVAPAETVPQQAVEERPVIDPEMFQRSARQSQTEGGAAQGEKASVAAANTPMGRYMKQVTTAVERRWHVKRRQYADFVSYGNLRVRFYVKPDGTTEDIEIVEQDANAVMAEFTIAAILEADAPPMPDGLSDELPEGRLEITYDVIVY